MKDKFLPWFLLFCALGLSGTAAYYSVVGLSDDDALKLEFSVVLLNQYGEELSGLSDIPSSIALRYKQELLGEALSEMTYSYRATH